MTGTFADAGHRPHPCGRSCAINEHVETGPDKGRPAGRGYQAYLLRCWQEGDEWRYSLEVIGHGRRQGFVALPGLLAALESELAALIRPDA